MFQQNCWMLVYRDVKHEVTIAGKVDCCMFGGKIIKVQVFLQSGDSRLSSLDFTFLFI